MEPREHIKKIKANVKEINDLMELLLSDEKFAKLKIFESRRKDSPYDTSEEIFELAKLRLEWFNKRLIRIHERLPKQKRGRKKKNAD